MQKNWLDAILMILATYRLTRLVVIDDGPFDWVASARDWAFARFDEEHWLNRGLSCPWCVSFWLALVVLFLPPMVYRWLGVAGAVALIYSWEFNNDLS